MANNGKTTFPNIPAKHWWALRNRFKQSIPNLVTAGYLATELGMEEKSAKANILPGLISFKLIDEDGKPTPRAIKWRDDQQYQQVCEEIKKEIYPQELIEAFPGSSPDKVAVEQWFANKTGVGEVAARRMALVFLLLSKADPSQSQDVTPPRKRTTKTTKSQQSKLTGPKDEKTSPPSKSSDTLPEIKVPDLQQPVTSPSLHIDIQIHIPPDASANQIDQIFASMAKHLYKNSN